MRQTILDAGCGFLSDHKKREGIGIDLQRGSCDVVADVHSLPFKSETFTFVYARNLLEHLNDPVKALNEMKRVMKKGAKISITIPIHHNPCVDELIKSMGGFPTRYIRTLRRLKRWKRYRRKPGFWHKNRIGIKHISEIFPILRSEKIYPHHSFSSVLRRVGFEAFYSPVADVDYVQAVKS